VALLLAVAIYLSCRGLNATGKVAELRAADVHDAKLKVLEDKMLRLESEAAVQSNRAEAAEAKYVDEKATNEPLRMQIEKMIGAEIIMQSELDKKRQKNAEMDSEAIAKMKTELDELKSSLADVEKEKIHLGDELAALREEMRNKQPDDTVKTNSAPDQLKEIIEILEEKKSDGDDGSSL
jgi:hypothetical protein